MVGFFYRVERFTRMLFIKHPERASVKTICFYNVKGVPTITLIFHELASLASPISHHNVDFLVTGSPRKPNAKLFISCNMLLLFTIQG